MTRPTPREVIRELIESSSVSQPTIRLLFVEQWQTDGKRHAIYYPVLGLHHRMVSIFKTQLSIDQPEPSPRLTPNDLLNDGWQFVGREERFGVVYLTPGNAGTPVSSLDAHKRVTDRKYKIVPAGFVDWPPPEVTE